MVNSSDEFIRFSDNIIIVTPIILNLPFSITNSQKKNYSPSLKSIGIIFEENMKNWDEICSSSIYLKVNKENYLYMKNIPII